MFQSKMETVSKLALMISAFTISSVITTSAADLGGNCCADLEERVVELESTTARKGNDKVSLKLYGQVNRAIMFWDNGEDSDIYSVGNENSVSRFGMKGKAKIGGGWSAGYRIEYGVNDTLSNKVDEDNDDATDGGSPSLRHDFLYLKNKSFGRIILGHTATATDGIAEIDLGGTSVIAASDVDDWQGDFNVANATGNAGTHWDKYFSNLDGGRKDIIRYDTPTFAGFTASGAIGEDDFYDVALRYANEFGGVLRFAAGIGYQVESDEDRSTKGDKKKLSGSASMMHVPTGLNLTVAAGKLDIDPADNGDITADASYYYLKAGWTGKMNAAGKTKIYGEYGSFSDYRLNDGDLGALGGTGSTNGSEATVYGVGIIQKIDAAAMDLFIGYRHYELDLDGSTTDASAQWDGVMAGARIKF